MKPNIATRRQLHKAPAFLLLMLLLPTSVKATEIIMICYPDGVVLAADSLRVDSNGAPVSRNACKIHQAGRVWWSAAGLTGGGDTGFSLEELFATSAPKNSDTKSLLDVVGTRITDALQRDVLGLKQSHPDRYRLIIKNGAVVLTLFATQAIGNRFDSSRKDFAIIDDRVVPQPSSSSDPTNRRIQLLMEKQPEVDRYIETNPDVWNAPAEQFVDRLMNVAIAADPDTIGPPVSILLIIKDGARWVRQNSCEAVNK